MPKANSEKLPAPPWQVPVVVDDVPETGQHFDLVADAGVRAAAAQLAGLRDLPRLQASFDVKRHSAGGLHVTGVVSATVGQNCVVTLEPLTNEVEEAVDLVFEPKEPPAQEEAETEPRDVKWGDPEPLIGGIVDLGALATEFLILGLDPYPRKPDAVFEPPQSLTPEESPFAALGQAGEELGSPLQIRARNRYSYSGVAFPPFGPRSLNVGQGPHCSRCDGGRPRPRRGRRRRRTGVGAPPRSRVPVFRQRRAADAAGRCQGEAQGGIADRPYRRRGADGGQAEPGAALRPLEIVDVAHHRCGQEGRRRYGGIRRQYRRADGDVEVQSQDAARYRAAGDRGAVADACAAN